MNKGVYLPNHRKDQTSVHYMKKIINGTKKYILWNDIKKVTAPTYDEFVPSYVLEKMNLKENKPDIWNKLKDLCPELEEKSDPKDR